MTPSQEKEARQMGPDNDFDNGLDNGLDVENVGMIAGFLCDEDEEEEEEKRWERPQNGMLDPADIGLEIGSFEDEE